ncbi:DUF2746 domain-containing protein [Bifidobacterium simiiventris]|uniref:DUF2746 domain-containing protein n=1 Tax=Bifidobacterium simiiventris TaxID=2834434 RepID=UPI001C581E75|nr:DUF2746 domain-containing protein [Bifidobacterium simiiventris]
MNLPAGLPAWAYILVSAMILAAQVVTALWIDRKGDERDTATRGEITNNHKTPLRDDLDEKNRRTLDAIDSLRETVEALRDDVNGEFATVNRRITTTEQNVVELRHEVNDLRNQRQ